MADDLVPGSRDLYFLLHDILVEYDLIPQLYPNFHQIYERKFHNILYLLSCVYLDASDKNIINIRRSIKSGFSKNKALKSLNVNDGIFDIIAQYATCTAFAFDTTGQIAEYVPNNITFNENENSVTFEDLRCDFLNVRGSEVLSSFDCNGTIRFDAYIFDHSDEMWIGIIDKSIYGPRAYTDRDAKCIFYYDGGSWRDRRSICAFGDCKYKRLEKDQKYGRADWISFCIDTNKQTMTFYKNREVVTVVNQLFDDTSNMVFNIILDKKGDGAYVDKVLFGGHTQLYAESQEQTPEIVETVVSGLK